MTFSWLSIACPHCGSSDVVYSCNPACCFNHVCNRCYTTFEPVTTKVGDFTGEIGPVPPDPDPTGPTAACARCGEITLLAITDDGIPRGRIVCTSCKALLTLQVTAVEPG